MSTNSPMLHEFTLAPGETIICTVDGLYLDMRYVPNIVPWKFPSPTVDLSLYNNDSDYNLALGTGTLTLTTSRLVVTWVQYENERIHHFSSSGIIGYSESPSDYEYHGLFGSKKAVSTIIYMATVMFLGGLCLRIACKRGEPEENQKIEHHARNSETVKLPSSLLAQALFLLRPSNADTGGLAAILAFEEKKRQEQDR
jgi:hypothetical protein